MKHLLALLLLEGMVFIGLVVFATASAAQTINPQPDGATTSFVFRDGDRIVVVGDSITVEGHYGRYLEAFLRTRFPEWKLSFRNAGINGQTAAGGYEFIESDVLVWRPTVVIVNYGMNDGRRASGVEFYKAGITRYVDRMQAAGTRVVLCSNSPLDIGDAPGTFTDYNRNFDAMALFLERFADERAILFVDQFHFCHRLWGENRLRGQPVPVTDQTLARHPSDPVHARAPGQLTMAYVILKTLGAPAEVSYAAVDASSGSVETRRCRITGLSSSPDGRTVSFVREDEASPCWIDDRGALGFDLAPFQQELNRMTLLLTSLPEGRYDLAIDEFRHGQYQAAELATGINLSLNRQSPLSAPGRAVEAQINEQSRRVRSAREVARFQTPAWLQIHDLANQRTAEFARHLPEIEAADARIADAAQTGPHRYQITRIDE